MNHFLRLAFLFFLLSCSPNSNVQTPGNPLFQGVWKEVLSKEKLDPKNMEYTSYEFRFTCDSVYMILRICSKFGYEDPKCFQKGVWSEYQKGGYKIKDDSLIIEGVYTKPNYKMKTSGCHHSGNFHEVFLISSGGQKNSLSLNLNSGTDTLTLISPHEEEMIHLHRTQKTVCNLSH